MTRMRANEGKLEKQRDCVQVLFAVLRNVLNFRQIILCLG